MPPSSKKFWISILLSPFVSTILALTGWSYVAQKEERIQDRHSAEQRADLIYRVKALEDKTADLASIAADGARERKAISDKLQEISVLLTEVRTEQRLLRRENR